MIRVVGKYLPKTSGFDGETSTRCKRGAPKFVARRKKCVSKLACRKKDIPRGKFMRSKLVTRRNKIAPQTFVVPRRGVFYNICSEFGIKQHVMTR